MTAADGQTIAPLPSDDDLAALLQAIYDRYHHDFRGYARASLKRRVARGVDALGAGTVDALRARVVADPAAFARLFALLTIQVTELFRDPAYFAFFRREVVPVLRTYPSRKLWVAGCATGEEAYSFAIILAEEGLLERTLIYATDIDADSLRTAEAAVYDIARVPAFTENHRATGAPVSLSEHYQAAYGGVALDRRLRERIVFADHSLATDAVFAEVQVVSCRNVLIYFGRELQERAIGLFAQALGRRGWLGLGPKETIERSRHAAAFTLEEPRARWYRRTEAAA